VCDIRDNHKDAGMLFLSSSQILATLARIETKLNTLLAQETKMALNIAALQAAVAQQTTVEQSVITLIQQMGAEIASLNQRLSAALAANDPVAAAAAQAALDQAVTTLNANSALLAAAVTANTPAAPTPAPAA
jgi:hypothetical protein